VQQREGSLEVGCGLGVWIRWNYYHDLGFGVSLDEIALMGIHFLYLLTTVFA